MRSSTLFDALCNATAAQEILNALIAGIWKKDGNEGEPPSRTTDALRAYEPVQIAHDRNGVPDIERSGKKNIVELKLEFGLKLPIYHTPELNRADQAVMSEIENIGELTIGEVQEHHPELWEKSNVLFMALSLFRIGVFLIEDIDYRIEATHRQWLDLRRVGVEIPHPLAPIVKEGVREWGTPTVEPERRTDTGILPHAIGETYPAPRLPMTVMETVPGEPEQLMLISNLPQVDLQLELPGFEFPESELVPALPLVAYETVGGRPSQQGGGAPISQRLFANILVEYAQKKRGVYGMSRLNTNYRDVKSWLYPKGTTNPKSVLIPRLYKGMYALHNLRFLWERRAWNIISVDALPTMEIRPDDPLTFTVRMPPGMNTSNGALIGIEHLRVYGAQAAPKFRAWVRLAYLWDAAKIRNGGKRIYATIPEVLRNSDGYLVDAKGEVILTGDLYHTREGWRFRNGSQPQKAWYHPLAIQTGEQVRNPQADKVPVLSDSDMVKLFYDHTERRGTAFTSCLELSKKHAEGMQDDGAIVVEQDQENEKTGIKGWRILEPYHR